MKEFGTLYRFELKKLVARPYVLLLLLVMVGVTLFLNVKPLLAQEEVAYVEEDGSLVFDTVSRYEAIQLERRFAREDAGTLLDNEAALEMREMNEYYQDVSNRPFTFILLNHFLVEDGISVTMLNPLWDGTDQMADVAYKAIETWQKDEYQSQRLTQEEIEYWEAERARIHTPYTLDYAKGYSGILKLAFWLNLMVLPFVFVCLCGSFSDDHVYKTWPILTSSKYGRKSLALARLAAGETLAGGTILTLFAITAAIQFVVHGAQGANTPIQLLKLESLIMGYPDVWLRNSSRAMTAGQGVLTTVGMSLLILLFAGALAMLLSKLFRRAIPALALPLGVLLGTLLVEDPFFYFHDLYDRVGPQIWSYFPIHRMSGEFLLDERLISLGGIQLESITASVCLYGLLAVLCLALCFWLYHIHTVEKE
ncbi:hypothetical protein H9X86_11100 [Pseudoflavonifractor capillosus]|uniref:hypothetical protein n=1 Tax=Pseudoflavonifractor capillosus TaxID=106588 RepID=UPI00195666F4|nr:hypothetical protein [Pseudoflavonifractor capillosus]MBM6897890.1 hypothetical protein [Pseudoflavonifractor capillosus]